jgi:uncharacterized protein (DUF608 family)
MVPEVRRGVVKAQNRMWKIIFILIFTILVITGLLILAFWTWVTTSGVFSISEGLQYLSFTSLAVMIAVFGILAVYYWMD